MLKSSGTAKQDVDPTGDAIAQRHTEPDGEATARSCAIAVTGLSHSFGGVKAVNQVRLDIPWGRVTGLIGPNGAGKSTLVNVLAGEIRPDVGCVYLAGQNVTRLPTFARARLGLGRMHQLSLEFGRLTVYENLLVAVQRHPGESLWRSVLLGERSWGSAEAAARERASDLLWRFGMADNANHLAETLSGGQKRLLELMRALMTEPKVLLLDEPMAGVHPARADELASYLRKLCDEGLTMLLIEHELGVVQKLCDEVVVMARGSVIARGSLADVRGSRVVQDAYALG